MYWIIGMIIEKISVLGERLIMKYTLHSFAEHGKNCHLEGKGNYTSSNISIGDNVYIGGGATFLSTDARIIIGNNVMFGPNVSIVTGNHRTDVVGKYMVEVKEKRAFDDEDVIICDDVWVGMNVTILKGVTIGRGSVIGANSLVTKNVPPYSIVTTKQETIIRPRFSEEEINLHERLLKNGNQ